MKKCPFCGTELNDDNLFCTECGKELPKGNKCPNCGASVNEGDVFCTECGKRIDEVPQTTSSEPTKPKCPHCGASINEGEVFCTECGKKIEDAPTIITETSANAESAETTVGNEDSVRTVVETPQVEEKEEESEYHYEYEEEPKTWRDYKLPIFGGIFVVLLLGACWWFYDSSNKRVAEEKAISDSLEVVRQDSIKKAEAKMEEEKEAADKEQHIAACKAFLEKFFKGLDDSNDLQEYVKQNTTFKAQQFLKDEYDLEDDCSNCLATWMFTKESGTELGSFRERMIEMIDENTYQVVSIYELDNAGQYTAYQYVVELGIVKEGNFYKIDTIEKISASPIIG